MFHINNRGAAALSRKAWLFLIGGMAGAALVTWIILMVKIFHKKNPAPAEGGRNKKGEYVIPEIPEGYALVFRQTKWYSSDGDKFELVSYSLFDSNGKEIERKDSDGRITDVYTYDDHGNMLSHAHPLGGDDSIEEFSYDSENHLQMRHTAQGTTEYVYNDQGEVMEEYYTGFDRKRFLSKRYEYDAKGHQTSEKEYDSNGEIRSERRYEYDEYGDVIRIIYGEKKEEAENGWEEYVRLEYVYDFVEPGIRKRIKEIFRGYANDEPEYHYFAYDSYGRVISWLPEDDDRSLLGDECEYDDYGNLTVVKEYVGTSSPVFVREYEYTPFVIPIEMMTDADKERIPNHGKP